MPDQIYQDAKNLGWDLRKPEEENKFRIECSLSPNRPQPEPKKKTPWASLPSGYPDRIEYAWIALFR